MCKAFVKALMQGYQSTSCANSAPSSPWLALCAKPSNRPCARLRAARRKLPQAAPAKATTTPRTAVIEEQVLEAAEQVRRGGATPTEQRIADRLHMKLADLRKFLRDNPRTKYQLQQIAKESA